MTIVPMNELPARSPRLGRMAAAILMVVGLIALALGATTSPVGAAPPAPTAEANAAIDWIGAQLAANGGSLPGFTPGTSDWGITADAVLAYVAAGRGAEAAAQTATDLLAANVDDYSTWGPSYPGSRTSGQLAKILLVLAEQGRSLTVAGVDLEAELRSLMLSSGAQIGRFADRLPDPTWDASNGFGQALSMLTLALTPGGVPAEATTFLIAQQCPAGGFRLTYTGAACTDDASADTDASGVAVQALLAVERTPAVEAALVRGIQWMLAKQDPATGAFGGTGPTSAINSNSSGLIAQALRAAGQTGPADLAATWISSTLQLNATNAVSTPAAAEIGAIAYDRGAFDTALVAGVDANAADQWRRASTQAVLALGLAPYGPVDNEPVVLPTTTTTTSSTTTTTASTVPVTESVDELTSGASGVDPDAVAGTGSNSSGSSSAGSNSSNSGRALGATAGSNSAGSNSIAGATRLAATGDESGALLDLGTAMLLLGVLLLAGSNLHRSTRR